MCINQVKKNENIFMQLFLPITFNLSCTLKYVLPTKGERDLFLLYVNIKVICCHSNIFPSKCSEHHSCFRFWANCNYPKKPCKVLCFNNLFSSIIITSFCQTLLTKNNSIQIFMSIQAYSWRTISKSFACILFNPICIKFL